jgi:hypothetical protein
MEILAVEARMELHLPEAFRVVLEQLSAAVSLRWQLPIDRRPPEPLRGIFSGGCEWSLADLPLLEFQRRHWVEQVFPDPENPYDRVWHEKLAFQAAPNGDLIALDLHVATFGRVVYLSHDDGGGHGYTLGQDFTEFIDKWTQLGCPGPEDWQMLPFVESATSGIDAYGANARLWRDWFGMQL